MSDASPEALLTNVQLISVGLARPPETAKLYQHRLGKRPVHEMLLGEAIEFAGSRLTALGAGHCLGSAMLLAEDAQGSFLYTGDFKLGASLTAPQAQPRRADVLVMESTFGRPNYRLPPRPEVIEQLLEAVHQAFAEGRTPVLHAYALGKSQEVTKILTTHGIPVQQHRDVWAISQVYEKCGVELATGNADVTCYEGRPLEGHTIVTTPKGMKTHRLAGLGTTYSISVTGWAADPSAKYRLKVDLALPLSDHADFDELIEMVRQVEPKRVYCTHGPREFVDHVRDAGFDAEPLVSDSQRRLF